MPQKLSKLYYYKHKMLLPEEKTFPHPHFHHTWSVFLGEKNVLYQAQTILCAQKNTFTPQLYSSIVCKEILEHYNNNLL